ncbi:MAG: hypothetical protein ACYTAF_16505 [Planctomycetota bacterium]|jgi:hypothetical protein
MATRKSRRERPKRGLTRKGYRVAEENFFARLKAKLNAMPGVYNPLDKRTYDASPKNRVTKTLDDRSTVVKKLIKKLAQRDLMKTYEEMPKNNVLVVEIRHKEMFGSRSVKAAVVGAAFSPSEELIRTGRSARRATAAQLNQIKDMVVTEPKVFYFVGAFCPTGWDDGCRHVLGGGNCLVALLDIHHGAWRTFFAPDARWRSSARLFDLTSEEEKIDAVRKFVERNTSRLLMDEMTEKFVFEELGYPLGIIREAFQVIASEDPFIRFDTGGRPFRLIRTYG